MLYREIIAVCSEIHTKHINTQCGQKVALLNVPSDSANISAVNYTGTIIQAQFLQPLKRICGPVNKEVCLPERMTLEPYNITITKQVTAQSAASLNTGTLCEKASIC
jgi:hypothetical protein